jgi:DNA mismatch endonuclease (patch repair protein)
MASVPHSNTAPELRLRRLLHRRGLRYRLHLRDLPGTPDIVFVGSKVAVFVHGCFWHRHGECHLATSPKTNARYWRTKFSENVRRDKRAANELREMGWFVAVAWECEVRKDADTVASAIARIVRRRKRHGRSDRAANPGQ